MMLFSALWNYIKPPPNYQDLKIREIRLTLNCVCVYMGACLCMCAGTYVRLDQPLVSLLKISLPSFWDNLFGAYTFVKAGWPGSCVMSLLCLSRSGVASAHHCEHFSCEHWAWTQVFLCVWHVFTSWAISQSLIWNLNQFSQPLYQSPEHLSL